MAAAAIRLRQPAGNFDSQTMMMASRKKPKRPIVPGGDRGQFTWYEIRQTAQAAAHAAGAVGIAIITTLATQANADNLWGSETFAGMVGVIVVTLLKMWMLKRGDNTSKRG